MKTTEIKGKAFESTDYDVLPNEFVATVVSEKDRDKSGKECVILALDLESGERISQKYSPLHYSVLAEALEGMHIAETHELVGKKFKFVSRKFSAGFPRWIPVQQVK
ncbi:MAG: hypothetical protein QXV17_13005 [Candidatus Micrarchaeaceae archaeon]